MREDAAVAADLDIRCSMPDDHAGWMQAVTRLADDVPGLQAEVQRLTTERDSWLDNARQASLLLADCLEERGKMQAAAEALLRWKR